MHKNHTVSEYFFKQHIANCWSSQAFLVLPDNGIVGRMLINKTLSIIGCQNRLTAFIIDFL